MDNGKLTILGCGSAMPTFQNSPSGQLLTLNDKSFLIDCGEGVHLTMRRMGVKTSRLYSVFISHLHGDHCFGLMGLISTLAMMSRTQPLHIYAHQDLEQLLRPQLDYYCANIPFEIIFHHINPRKSEVIFESRNLTVTTIPLKHTVPCCGFLFTELNRKRYAYCSDTMYSEKILPLIDGVDTLYHEATYTEQYADKCSQTMHSTARQAAAIADKAHAGQLIIGHYSAREDNHGLFLEEAKAVFANTQKAEEKSVFDI